MIVPSRAFYSGEVIFRQGDAANGEAFLVHEGTVEVRTEIGGHERMTRVLGKGDLLGEVALFGSAPHSATATATTRVTLLVLPADRLEEMVEANPKLAMALIRQLARMAAGAAGEPGRP